MAEFNKLCIEIKKIVSRFDAYFCSLSKAIKCDFQCEIDTILTCFMDKSLEDDYIEKMKEIAILSDNTKTLESVRDAVYDVQKDVKENAEDSRNRLCKIQETLDKLHMEREKDKVEDTTLVHEKRDCNEDAGISCKDIALEMPQGMKGKICIIKCYADLKLELERDIGMDIVKELFQKKKHKDVLEDLHQAGTRRLCIDRLLKRVLKLEASGLKIFFDLLKRKCPEIAQKLAEIKVTDKDMENFIQVSESVQEVPHRMQNGLKFEQLDVKFFQGHFQDTPEKVDKRADVLLSQFRISICDHSQMMQYNDPVKKIHALLEKIQSCHFDSDSEVQSVLGSKLYQTWQRFKVDGSRQGLENQGIWHCLLERIQSSREYLIEHFRGLRIYFMQARRGSLVLKFVTLDNFDVKLLKPEAVKTKVWDMIKTLCPAYQDIFKEPVHLTIFFKPLSDTDRAEIYFYLETSTEKEGKEEDMAHSIEEEFSCMKLGSHDKHYIVEEMNPASLNNWMFNTLQLDEDTRTKLVDLVSRKDMSRRKKMKILLNIVESLGNGYELLEKYCEEHDAFLYDNVFKKHRQLMVEENPNGAQQYEFSHENEEGLQRLFSTWIDFTVDPKEDLHSKEGGLMTHASDQPFSLNTNPSHSSEEQYAKDRFEREQRHANASASEVGCNINMLFLSLLGIGFGFASIDVVVGLVVVGLVGLVGLVVWLLVVGLGRQQLDSSLPPILPYIQPTERQLGRISMKIGYKSVLLGQALGLSEADIQQIQKVYSDTATQSLMICFKWMLQSGDKATFRNLEMAFKCIDIDTDILKSVNKAVDSVSCLPPDMLNMQPEDKHLNQISNRIETEHVHLGVELEVPLSRIEQILTENLVDVHRQCFEIMKEWRQRKVWQATFWNLENAFICVGIDPDILKESLK